MHANLTDGQVDTVADAVREVVALPTPPTRPAVVPPMPLEEIAPAENRTVFFTGGAGFIGLHVVPLLLERGYRVRIFDNMFRGDRDAVAGWPRAATSS